jgi:hypothetical protein
MMWVKRDLECPFIALEWHGNSRKTTERAECLRIYLIKNSYLVSRLLHFICLATKGNTRLKEVIIRFKQSKNGEKVSFMQDNF